MKRSGREYGRPIHDSDNESFDAECLRETGYPPGHYGDLFRWERTSGLSWARGGLPGDARLARAAIRLGGVVVDVEYLPLPLHSLVDWEVFALMWANYDGQPWVYTGQFPFAGVR